MAIMRKNTPSREYSPGATALREHVYRKKGKVKTSRKDGEEDAGPIESSGSGCSCLVGIVRI